MIAGVVMLLGELTYYLADYDKVYSLITLFAAILITIYSSIVKRKIQKSLIILLFVCFLAGVLWGYGFYHRGASKLDGAFASGDVVEVAGEVISVDEKDYGTYYYISCSEGKLCVYVKGEKKETDVSHGGGDGQAGMVGDVSHGGGAGSSESTSHIHGICPGDRCIFRGRLDLPRESTNPGGYDRRSSLRAKGIKYEMKADFVERCDGGMRGEHFTEVSDSGAGTEHFTIIGWMRKFAYRLRIRLGESLEKYMSKEKAGILKAMMLGDKDDLDENTKLLYQKSGIAHVLAISGLHVALVAGMIEFLLGMMGISKKKASGLVIVVLFFYGFMTGFAVATMRAVIMITISRIGRMMGRVSDTPTTMTIVLIIFMILNPASLLDAGTHLSFAAVFGIYVSEVVYRKTFEDTKRLKKHKPTKGEKKIGGAIITSLGLNACMMPVMLYYYYELPLYGMLLNTIVIPLLTVLIASGIGVVLLNLIPLLGNVLCPIPAFVCARILDIYELLCRLTLKLPMSRINPGHMEVWQVVISYLLIVMGVMVYVRWDEVKKFRLFRKFGMGIGMRMRSGNGKGKGIGTKMGMRLKMDNYYYVLSVIRYIVIVSVVMIMIAISTFAINTAHGRVVFLDVGQGDGCIIHEPFGRNYIVDCGSSSMEEDEVGRYVLINTLKYYGMSHVRTAFISHTDADHVNGLVFAMENKELFGIKVDNLAMAKGTDEDEYLGRLMTAARKSGSAVNFFQKKTKVYGASSGEVLDGHFEVLYPIAVNGEMQAAPDGSYGGNEYSLVLKYMYGDKDFIFTGDIGAETEKRLLNSFEKEKFSLDDQYVVLKVPHHGSKYSSSSEFLKAVNPDIAVISCSERNMYGHPSPDTLKRLEDEGIPWICTKDSGAVEFKIGR